MNNEQDDVDINDAIELFRDLGYNVDEILLNIDELIEFWNNNKQEDNNENK